MKTPTTLTSLKSIPLKRTHKPPLSIPKISYSKRALIQATHKLHQILDGDQKHTKNIESLNFDSASGRAISSKELLNQVIDRFVDGKWHYQRGNPNQARKFHPFYEPNLLVVYGSPVVKIHSKSRNETITGKRIAITAASCSKGAAWCIQSIKNGKAIKNLPFITNLQAGTRSQNSLNIDRSGFTTRGNKKGIISFDIYDQAAEEQVSVEIDTRKSLVGCYLPKNILTPAITKTEEITGIYSTRERALTPFLINSLRGHTGRRFLSTSAFRFEDTASQLVASIGYDSGQIRVQFSFPEKQSSRFMKELFSDLSDFTLYLKEGKYIGDINRVQKCPSSDCIQLSLYLSKNAPEKVASLIDNTLSKYKDSKK